MCIYIYIDTDKLVLLLKAGADVTSQFAGRTALEWCADPTSECAEDLRRAGASAAAAEDLLTLLEEESLQAGAPSAFLSTSSGVPSQVP